MLGIKRQRGSLAEVMVRPVSSWFGEETMLGFKRQRRSLAELIIRTARGAPDAQIEPVLAQTMATGRYQQKHKTY